MDTRKGRQARRFEGGFTLLEMLLVLVIIGVLAAVIGPNLFTAQDKALVQSTRSNITVLSNAVEQFRMDMLRVPSTEEGLKALVEKPTGDEGKRWAGPYLKNRETIPNDGWDRPFNYRAPGDGGRQYEIVSYGADGKAGGEGTAADIKSWVAKED